MPLAKYDDKYPFLTQRLRLARLNDRTAHAWILSGNKLAHIREFVTAWLQSCVCPSLSESGDGCGLCTDCQSLEHGKYPYLYELKPVSKSRQILIDAIRELEHSLHLRTDGKKKIGVLFEADRMVNQAQNAFLKTLEEPPPNTLLVLITARPEGLLPTIRSRCQSIPLTGNRFELDFKGCEELYAALAPMNRGKGALIATDTAQKILNILSRIRLDAKAKDESKDADELSYINENPTLKKKIAAEEAAMDAANYLAKRDLVISAIHTWFAQEYMRANNISIPTLTHSEIYETLSNEQISTTPDPKDSLSNLMLVDDLVENLQFNVDEKLMIQDFCHKLCSKN